MFDVVIDNDVVVFVPMLDFAARAQHAPADDLRWVLCTHIEPFLKRLSRRRKDKNCHNVALSFVSQLRGALPVYIEEHIATFGQRAFNSLARRTPSPGDSTQAPRTDPI